jgi:hypothetical protein
VFFPKVRKYMVAKTGGMNSLMVTVTTLRIQNFLEMYLSYGEVFSSGFRP